MIVYQKIFQKFHLGIWLLIVLFATFDRKEANTASIKVRAIEKDEPRTKMNQSQNAKCQEEADECFNKFSNDFPQKWKEIESDAKSLMEHYVSG